MSDANDQYRIVIDVDGTLAQSKSAGESYADLIPRQEVVEKLREYRANGFYVIIYSSRNMRTYANNTGLIQANTLPVLLDWLKKHDVPFDEVHIGKPWCGFKGFYVDDKTIRPDEFVRLSAEEIQFLVGDGDGG
jgi:capsule biosynthesis phosphatase